MIAQFFFLAATLLAGGAYARCPSQEWSEYEGNCYLVAKASINHPQAQANCTAKGANLLSVHNEAENQFVKELLRKLMAQTGAGGSFHIGMMFSRSNPDATGPITSAVWMDGTPVDFGNPAEKGFQPGTGPWSDGKWHGGEAEPNGDGLNRHGPVELCVTVPQSQLVNGEWADSNCGSLAGMICKKPAPSASATV